VHLLLAVSPRKYDAFDLFSPGPIIFVELVPYILYCTTYRLEVWP